MELEIPSPSGKKVWQTTTVESILANEKYKGDARLQKKFTVDFRTKKRKINEGELCNRRSPSHHRPRDLGCRSANFSPRRAKAYKKISYVGQACMRRMRRSVWYDALAFYNLPQLCMGVSPQEARKDTVPLQPYLCRRNGIRYRHSLTTLIWAK